MSKISIIMPVYNAEEHLAEALDSVLNQTFTDFEVICIDDCSTDNSFNILQRYARSDERVKVFHNIENSKVAKTLNFAISKVDTGTEYIARMDADDICLPDRLRVQYDFMKNHPNIDICGTFFQHFGESDNIVKLPTKHREIIARMALKSFSVMGHPTLMIKKEILLKNDLQYDVNSNVEDYDLLCRAHMQCNAIFANIPQVLLKYRVHSSQLSFYNKKNMKKDADKVRAMFESHFYRYHLWYFKVRYVYVKKLVRFLTRYLWPDKK